VRSDLAEFFQLNIFEVPPWLVPSKTGNNSEVQSVDNPDDLVPLCKYFGVH
jgi:hypothetical protein